MYDEAIWIRIQILDSARNPFNSLCIVYFVHSDYVLISSLKQQVKAYVLEALACALNLQSINQLQLTGKDVHSLLDILLHKSSQGSFSKFRKDEQVTPLGQKRKQSTTDLSLQNISLEDIHTRKKLQRQNNDIFGSYPQAALQKIHFKIEGELPYKLTLEGTNVLDGIKSLVLCGIAETPTLNHHLHPNQILDNLLKPIEIIESIGQSELVIINK